MIGGGRPGREAARQHAADGTAGRPRRRGPRLDPLTKAFEVTRPARALGIYEGGLVPVDAGRVLYRFRAEQIVVATGTIEQPLVFPGNDLVGVDAARRRPPAGRGLGAQAGREGRRRDRGRARAARPRPHLRAGRRRGRRGRRPARDARPRRSSRAAAAGVLAVGRARRPQARLRPPRHVRRPPARLLAPRPGGRAGRVRPGARHLRPDRPPRRHRGRRRRSPGEGLDGAVPAASYNGAAGQGQVLRLHLRGRDRQGREAGDRRGLRLDRARQALHDRDDGPLPGPALPRALDPPLRARERERTRRRSARRLRARRGRRSRSACSRAGRTSPRSGRRSTTATRSSARR